MGFEPLLFRAKELCSRYTTWPICWFFPFVLLERIFVCTCSSRLVAELGWKLPSKSIPTAFHVDRVGIEPTTLSLQGRNASLGTCQPKTTRYSTIKLSDPSSVLSEWDSNPYLQVFVDTGEIRTHNILTASQAFSH